MAHMYAHRIQQICNMTKGSQRIKILGAKGTLIKIVKLNRLSLPVTCFVQLHGMGLQNSLYRHNKQSPEQICNLQVRALAQHPGQGNPRSTGNQTHFVLVQTFNRQSVTVYDLFLQVS